MTTWGMRGAVDAVRRSGGLMRTRALIASGVSKHHQVAAVRAGVLRRVGRSWLALPEADPMLVAAARAGVVLTCITQAQRLGLWVLTASGPPHVSCAPNAHARAPRCHVHWSVPLVPRPPDALVDPIENVLVTVARCRPHEEALAIWESALNKRLVDHQLLRRLPLPSGVRTILEEAVIWADSGLETLVRTRLAWLKLPIASQTWIAGHRVDFLIGDRLVLQVDGGHHVGAQRDSDIAHDAQLMLMGYHVMRVGYRQVVDQWHMVQDLVMRAVAQGLHRA